MHVLEPLQKCVVQVSFGSPGRKEWGELLEMKPHTVHALTIEVSPRPAKWSSNALDTILSAEKGPPNAPALKDLKDL